MRRTSLFLIPTALLTLACILPLGQTALAHGVHVQQQSAQAVTVEFTYEDQSPLSFEQYEVIAPQGGAPFQVGRTDRVGRVVFRPDAEGEWLVRVWTEDGHGGSTRVQVADGLLAGAADSGSRGGRLTRLILGPLAILGLFWLISLIMKKL